MRNYYSIKTKLVPLKSLSVGTKFCDLRVDGMYRHASYEIIKTNPYVITVLCYGKEEEINAENAYVELPLSEDELAAYYAKEISAVKKAMKNKLSIGENEYPHELWNEWIDSNPLAMAVSCSEGDIAVVGWFPLSRPVLICLGTVTADIGIVAEDIYNGNRFWCHASSKWFEDEEWGVI